MLRIKPESIAKGTFFKIYSNCSDRNIKVKCTTLLGNHNRQTDRGFVVKSNGCWIKLFWKKYILDTVESEAEAPEEDTSQVNPPVDVRYTYLTITKNTGWITHHFLVNTFYRFDLRKKKSNGNANITALCLRGTTSRSNVVLAILGH